MRTFYFGCWDVSGHYLFRPDKSSFSFSALSDSQCYRKPRGELEGFPWGWWMDGGMQPKDQTEGHCIVHHAGDHHAGEWSALAFWDRSVDGRPKSCSVFFVEGYHTFSGMLMLFEAKFPGVFSRFRFPLVHHSVCDCPAGGHGPHAALSSSAEDTMAKKKQDEKKTETKRPYKPPTVETEIPQVGPLVLEGDGPLPYTGQPLPYMDALVEKVKKIIPPVKEESVGADETAQPIDLSATAPKTVAASRVEAGEKLGFSEGVWTSEGETLKHVVCDKCRGTGIRPAGSNLPNCPECNGGGTVLR